MAGIVPSDEVTIDYLDGRAVRDYPPVQPTDDAAYS
jgi:hypothetical protein